MATATDSSSAIGARLSSNDGHRTALTASAAPATTTSAVGISQESALRVVKGSLGLSAMSGVGAMMYGVLKAQPAVLYGVTAGFYSFTYVFPMFAVREYVIGPLLRQGRADDILAEKESLHTHNVLASTISASVAGVAMRTYFRGRPKLMGQGGLVPGLIWFGIAGAGVQFIGNELRIARIFFLSRSSSSATVTAHNERQGEKGFVANLREGMKQPINADLRPDPALTYQLPTSRQQEMDATLRLPAEPSEFRKSRQALEPPESVVNAMSWMDKALNTLASYSPVKRISDDEYEQRLLRQREEKIEQLRELERQIALEQQQQKW